MAENLYLQHINQQTYNDWEAARTGFFSLIVDDLDGIIKATYAGDNPESAPPSDKIGKAQEILKLNVLTADVPHFSLETLQYKRGNEVVKFAGVPTFNSGSVKVDDVVGLDTKAILMAWQGKAYNVHTGKGGRMGDYKKHCTLIEYDQAYTQVRSWDLYGCWIKELSEDAFDRENDGKRAITATIEFDRAIMREAD